MNEGPTMDAEEWVRRVNHTWIVHSHLSDHAQAWLEHLAASDDGRLEKSCWAARALFKLRAPLDDPKPWFYAGLFSTATASEAKRFLGPHRVTKATVPALAEDEEVVLWLERVGEETRELIARLRQGLLEIRDGSSDQETLEADR